MTDKTPIQSILEILRARPSTLIVAHNNPDPDCIASCQALKYILFKSLKLRTRIVYGGFIGRAENRAMIQRLKIDLTHIRNMRINRYEYLILVDTQEAFSNHILVGKDKKIISIDHHPQRKRKKMTVFSDIRPHYGASSSILTEYLCELELPFDPYITTGLYYGIKTDTMDFSRSYSPNDFEAFKKLFPHIKNHLLAKILRPSIPICFLRIIAHAVDRATLYGKTVIIPLGIIQYPDMVGEVADIFLRLEKITWSLCYGIYGSEVNISLRTTSRIRNAGHIMRKMVGKIGAAGGHEMSGGAQIPLVGRPEDLETFMQPFLSRYLKSIGEKSTPGTPLRDKDPDCINTMSR